MKRCSDEIIRANQNLGHHFFSPSTMRWFKSRVTTHTYDAGDAGTVLLISNRRDGDPRSYVPVLSQPDGRIESLADYDHGMPTLGRGQTLCRRVARLFAAGTSIDDVKAWIRDGAE